jgi:hypothetical protein
LSGSRPEAVKQTIAQASDGAHSAWRFAEAIAQAGVVLRVLKLPSSGLEVLWLAGSDDRTVDLGFVTEPELAGLDLIARRMPRPI